MEIFHERLSDICISRELRDYLRNTKKEKTYDQFLRELIEKSAAKHVSDTATDRPTPERSLS